jgi:Rieske Fe-S protein
MNRRSFLKTACKACIGSTAIAGFLQSCMTGKYVTEAVTGNELVVPISQFQYTHKGETRYRTYLVVQNDVLQYPICVYRINENKYTALWMRCSHQGAELQVFGDKLQCPAHGSEFNNEGEVINPPATTNLRSFQVIIEETQLRIKLK